MKIVNRNFMGLFLILMVVSAPLCGMQNSTASLQTPLLDPSCDRGDIEQGGIAQEANLGLLKRLKEACVSGVKNSWSKLSRGTKDATEVAVLAGINGGAMAYKAYVRDDQVPVLTSYATGQTAADVTERIGYYWKILASALAIGGCEAVRYLTDIDLSVFSNSAIVYAIHGSFERYAIATGRKNTFSEDFRDLPADLQKEISQRIEKLAGQVHEIQNQQTQIGDIEMGAIVAQAQPGSFERFKKSCTSGVKNCWSKVPRGVKDTIELVGLAGVDGASLFYKYYYGNRYLSLLTSYAIGKTAADITERQKYYWKILAAATIITGYELVKYFSGADLWTFSTSAIMYLIHSSLEEYAVLTGRKNKFTENFRDLPTDLQELIIGRIKKLAEQVRLIKSGKASMVAEGYGTMAPVTDVEMGVLPVTPTKPAKKTQPVAVSPASPVTMSPASTTSSPASAELSTGSPAQTDYSCSSSSPERAREEFDIESLGELKKLDEVARNLDEQLRLLPTVEAKQNLIKQWWSKLGRGKKDAIELFGIAGVGTLIDGFSHLFATGFVHSWWVSVFFAYASGKMAEKITRRQKYYLKVLAGLATWLGAWRVMEATKFNWATMGIASLMYIVHTTFEEYRIASGRSNDGTKDFQQLPSELQQALVRKLGMKK